MSHKAKTQGSISRQTAARLWQATLQRDRRADGSFVFAVRSTRVYCRPSCPARRPLRQNAVFFRSPQEAENRGFRPCRRCRPKDLAAATALVSQAASLFANSSEENVRLESIAAQMNSSPEKLRRAFRTTTGLSPREFAEAARMKQFKRWPEHYRSAVCLWLRFTQPHLRKNEFTFGNDTSGIQEGSTRNAH
jgi:methylphosphotriester-DNA--protein-cysteine methyltransferase